MNRVAVPCGFGGIAARRTLLTENNLVAPTGFGSQASFFEIGFQGLALPRCPL